MIGRAATRIDLKIDDDLKELEEEHMIKLREQKKQNANQQTTMFLNNVSPQIG